MRLNQKERVKGLTNARRQKPWERFEGKQQKIGFEFGSVEEREIELFLKVLSSEEHLKISCFKKTI